MTSGHEAAEASKAATFLAILCAFAVGAVGTAFSHEYLGAGVVYIAAFVLLVALAWLVWAGNGAANLEPGD